MITQHKTHSIQTPDSSQVVATRVSEPQRHYLALLESLPLKVCGALDPINTVGITSCTRGEGVSTVAAHLSMAAASKAMKVLLVDLNWKHPTVHRIFGVDRGPGLMETLMEQEPPDPLIQKSNIPDLSLMTIGDLNGDLSQAGLAEKLAEVIRSLEADYDLVIFDLQESTSDTLTSTLSSLLDGVVLVIEAEKLRWEVVLRAKELLTRSGATILGTVMNKRRLHIPRWLSRTL